LKKEFSWVEIKQHNKNPKKTGETQYTEKKPRRCDTRKKSETFITFELEGINHFSATSFGMGEKLHKFSFAFLAGKYFINFPFIYKTSRGKSFGSLAEKSSDGSKTKDGLIECDES
jgi:hypothetical protein